MQEVNVGIVGLGNVGSSTLAILAENGEQIALKLGYKLKVVAVCSRSVHTKNVPAALGPVLKTTDWRDVVSHPDVQIVAELVGGTSVAGEIVNAAIANRKSVVTANKELMAACGPDIWDRAIQAGINLAMEASVCGGIPIHAVLRKGISGDRVMALYGILTGTCNYILTEMEKTGAPLESILAEAQRLGYAEADPSADIDGFDARSKLVLLAALAFGERITPADIYMEGIRRITPLDFRYAQTLKHTIRLICGARTTPDGLILSVRPALLPSSTILASVQGPYNAVWVKGQFGEDTFYYGWGAGHPTGVAVVSDLMDGDGAMKDRAMKDGARKDRARKGRAMNTAGLFLWLALAGGMSAQVASQANAGYQTPQQREAVAKGLADPARDERQKPREL